MTVSTEERYRFTSPKVKELLTLNSKEFSLFIREVYSILIQKNKLEDSEQPFEGPFVMFSYLKTMNTLCSKGLLVRSEQGEIKFGYYDQSAPEIITIDLELIKRTTKRLTMDEQYVYFMLLFQSFKGVTTISLPKKVQLSNGIKTALIRGKFSRLFIIEKELTAKGFLAPVEKVEDDFIYRLYDGNGRSISYIVNNQKGEV